ncbi:MAG: Xaa-Pro peptidase family protein [Gammaproteobacteria bacterium]|jgi:Xaa-Pro aminopeptidase
MAASAQPPRGFPVAEYEARTERAQRMMREYEYDALLLTTEAQLRYFTGFLTQFWQSPTRPWYLVVPASGKPIAVIPTIGLAGMRETWIDDIRDWPSPRPKDDGVSLLAETIRELPRHFDCLGLTFGQESLLRMPMLDYWHLRAQLPDLDMVDCAEPMLKLMSVKSAAETDKIRHVCELASDSFEALPEFAASGQSEREILRAMRIDLLRRGADNTPFIVCASGPDGYGDIIMGPRDRELEAGDILIIDTGTVYDGYFCDFDRNFAFGRASDTARRVYETVYRSTDAGLAAARPGATTTDVWQAMWSVLEAGGAKSNDVGRMGHGLGAQLTEWPSLTSKDQTPLEPGMVITLEPGMNYGDGKIMVHEENIVITDSGAQLLSRRAAPELPIIN